MDDETKRYSATGRIEIIGNHTDHQGGRVMVAPAEQKITADVCENGRDMIRIMSEGYDAFDVSITDRTEFRKGTTEALVVGMLDGFASLFGSFDGFLREGLGITQEERERLRERYLEA